MMLTPRKPRRVSTANDAEAYLGRFVAFTSDSYYFSRGSRAGYYYSKKGEIIAYVDSRVDPWNTGEAGPNMTRLHLNLSEGRPVSGNCALIPSLLRDARLDMRCVSDRELDEVRAELEGGSVVPEYGNAKSLLERT